MIPFDNKEGAGDVIRHQLWPCSLVAAVMWGGVRGGSVTQDHIREGQIAGVGEGVKF